MDPFEYKPRLSDQVMVEYPLAINELTCLMYITPKVKESLNNGLEHIILNTNNIQIDFNKFMSAVYFGSGLDMLPAQLEVNTLIVSLWKSIITYAKENQINLDNEELNYNQFGDYILTRRQGEILVAFAEIEMQ